MKAFRVLPNISAATGTIKIREIQVDPAKLLALAGHKAQPIIDHRGDDYSTEIVLQHGSTGEVFSLYRRYGEWRVAAKPGHVWALEELVSLIA